MAEQINLVIENLCEKLGIATEYLMPLLVRQARIDAITNMVLCIAFAAFIYATVRMFIFWNTPAKGEEYTRLNQLDYSDRDGCVVLVIAKLVVMGILSVIFLIAFFAGVFTIAGALGNPEWYAITELLEQLR